LHDPEVASARYPAVEWKRFSNGEWVFGVSSDSHTSSKGGTIVLKDSSGKIHTYFGHVCGPRRLECMFQMQCDSLKSFYELSDWSIHDLKEVNLSNPIQP
jgi:hypothetical protein